ncbi:hypothetical protein M408DRAFT_325624 [Serendipita vermifera MAFF 305830]|uniref:Uncharacterized protein n=1 Tax=Serendipita vermifera MAFF 305830 TaxID=933852 RepID=A0A0C2X7W7_SERVB|nr:hypothetical protein M408DRAFT_325624 [Serendipita vermifera MAFF 305830]
MIGQLDSDREASLAHATVTEARVSLKQARAELKELSELRIAREESDKRLKDNKQIINTLEELLPPFVDKVRDVHTDFEEFEEGFPKLEDAVEVFYARSRKTGGDIDELRKRVGGGTQQNEAFLRLWMIAPLLVVMSVSFMYFAV